MATKRNTKRVPRPKNGAWFVAVRGSFLPCSWQGWLTYAPFTLYLLYSLWVAFEYTGNNLKAVLWVVPNWVAATVVMTWIAQQKS